LSSKTASLRHIVVNPVGTGGDPSYAKVVANPTQPSGQLSVSNIPQNPSDVKEKNR